MQEKSSEEAQYEEEIQARIAVFRAIKEKLARMHGRKIPRSLLGPGGEDAREKEDRDELKGSLSKAKAFGMGGHSYERQRRWDEILPRAHEALKADLEPYFERFRLQAESRITEYYANKRSWRKDCSNKRDRAPRRVYSHAWIRRTRRRAKA